MPKRRTSRKQYLPTRASIVEAMGVNPRTGEVIEVFGPTRADLPARSAFGANVIGRSGETLVLVKSKKRNKVSLRGRRKRGSSAGFPGARTAARRRKGKSASPKRTKKTRAGSKAKKRRTSNVQRHPTRRHFRPELSGGSSKKARRARGRKKAATSHHAKSRRRGHGHGKTGRTYTGQQAILGGHTTSRLRHTFEAQVLHGGKWKPIVLHGATKGSAIAYGMKLAERGAKVRVMHYNDKTKHWGMIGKGNF